MQRFLRIHCRGAPSGRTRPEKVIYSSTRPFNLFKPIVGYRWLRNSAFTCQKDVSLSRFSFRDFPRQRFLLAVAATIPVVVHASRDDPGRDESTLEQHLLDTSEEERRTQKHLVDADRSIFYRFFKHIKITFVKYIYE